VPLVRPVFVKFERAVVRLVREVALKKDHGQRGSS
jgi:hypothetical protein